MGSQPRPWFPLAGAFGALGVAALYLTIIWQEGEGELTSGRVLLVVGSVGVAALALIAALFVPPRKRAFLLSAATMVLAVWAFLGTLSIGILLWPSVVLGCLAAKSAHVRRESSLGVLAGVLLVAVGLVLT